MWCHWRFYCRNRSEHGYQAPPRPAGDVLLHGACALGHLPQLIEFPFPRYTPAPWHYVGVKSPCHHFIGLSPWSYCLEILAAETTL